MGEVWKARDTRLDRVVAIKFSKSEFSERFEREARAVAALNHPSICTLYDIGPDYLVMEFVDGTPLKGPLPTEEALRLAAQIADALDAAHRKGIVHRDLKPANILVTRAGVKLLDFGLAKMQSGVTADQETMSMALTGKGEILGTLNYMSPEQVQGKEADARSDIFSFGLVLYEALTGRSAFRAENPASLIAAILKEQPEPLERLAPVAPAALKRLIARALEKDPERRWQSARDMALEIESILATPAETVTVPKHARRGFGWKAIAATALVSLLAGAAGFRWLQNSVDVSTGNISVVPIAVEPYHEDYPLFSPDGKSVAFSRGRRGAAQVMVRSLAAASPVQISDCKGRCVPFAWSADAARVYYADANGVWVAGASGGGQQLITKSVPVSFRAIALSPDGRSLVFSRTRTDGTMELAISSPPGSEAKPMADFPASRDGVVTCKFSPDGHKLAVITTRNSLAILAFPGGKPLSISTRERSTEVAWLPDSRHVVIVTSYGRPSEATLLDTESSASIVVLRSEEVIGSANVSPDGRRMLYHSGISDSDLMELDIDTATLHTLRATRLREADPIYSPAGDQYAYVDYSTGRSEIVVRDTSGSRATQLTFDNPEATNNVYLSRGGPRYSPDGRRIAYTQNGRVWTIPASGGQPVSVAPPSEIAMAVAWSPDNRWIAYHRRSGRIAEVVKLDSAGQGTPMVLSNRASTSIHPFTRWSLRDAIAYSAPDGVRICAPDATGDRLLAAGVTAGDFNRTGDLFYGLKPEDGQWKLLTVEVVTGRVRRTAAIDETGDGSFAGASLHRDGKRLALTRNENKYDIWMLEGLPRPETGWMRIFRHWTAP